MKDLNKTVLLLLLLFNVNNNLQAKQITKDFSPKINVEFIYAKKKLPDSIYVHIYPTNSFWDETINITAKIDLNNRSALVFPQIRKPTLILISLINSENANNIGWYYIEPGDNIHMKISSSSAKDTIIFSGSGSEKFKLIEKLTRQFEEFDSVRRSLPFFDNKKISDLDINLQKFTSIVQLYTTEMLESVSVYKNQLSPNIRDILKYEYALKCHNEWGWRIEFLYDYYKDSINYRSKIRNFYNLNRDKFISKSDDDNCITCPFYIGNIASSLKRTLYMNNESESADLVKYYNLLKNNYSKSIKERLLIEFLNSKWTMEKISNYNPKLYDSLFIDAKKYLTSEYGREIVIKKSKFRKGTLFFNVDFIDLNGKNINTAALKGKVFLMDIWGEGCGGCAAFHTKFHTKIWPALKNNNDFIVLSVSIDKKREKWIQGISTGKLSSYDYLNVSTGPKGVDHSFLKHYDINYIPFLLLVDKDGRIITKISGFESTDELIEIIKSALNGPILTAR
jgi:thiol-disulfide isomerase/thioredoxin